METIITPAIKPTLRPSKELLSSSWEIFKNHYKKLLLITLVMLGPNIINQILIGIFMPEQSNRNFTAVAATPHPAMAVVIIIMSLLSLVASVWGTIALITFIHEKNDQQTVSDIFNKNASLFWSYLWAGVIVGVLVMLATLLLIVPGIIYGIYFSLYAYIVIIEKITGYDAAKKSKELITDYWWPIFGRMLVLGLTLSAILLAILLFIIPVSLESDLIGSLIIYLLTLPLVPFSTIYVYQLYQNLKTIKNV